MSKYVINDTTLTAIADAVRTKAGTTEPIIVSDLPDAIAAIPTGGGGELEIPVVTWKCNYRFSYDGWSWFIEQFGNQMTTAEIANTMYMFYYSSQLVEIPFDINLKKSSDHDFTSMFAGCKALTKVPLIKGDLPVPTSSYSGTIATQYIFDGCNNLREIPFDYFYNFGGEEFWKASQELDASKPRANMFYNCYSLRELPDISMLMNKSTATYSCFYNALCSNCYALNRIIDLPVSKAIFTSNAFSNTVNYCERIKDFTFKTNEDGTPLTASWKSQTIDLSNKVGWNDKSGNHILNYNSGITVDTLVKDDATYQALKDNPDWWTQEESYSRYDHDSAVRTINSLPDTSAYLAANGGSNTIKFKGAAGANTDAGAINTLTEEEIAVAAAKGWTVTLV